MRILKLLILLQLMIFQLLTGQELVDGIVATVADKAILLSEVNNMATQMALQQNIDISKNKLAFVSLRKKVLQSMIDQNVLLLKAEDDTIVVEDEAIDSYLDQQLNYLISQAGSREKLAEIYGLPFTEIKRNLREEVEKNMKIERLRQQWFANIKVSRKEVEEFFTLYKDSLPKQEETVDISHILKSPTPSDSASLIALSKIKKIAEELKNGKSFEELAKQYSEDPASAVNGGSLGWSDRGTFVPEFEEVAFELKKGEVSDVVQTQFGYHIIKLNDRQGERINVSHILVRVTTTDADEQRTIQFLDSLRSAIIEGKISFEEAAVQFSDDPNAKQDKGHLGEYVVSEFKIKEFLNVLKTMQEGEISSPFKTEFGIHIVKLHKRIPARELDLNKDYDKIYQMAKNYKGQREFSFWIEELKKEYPIEIKMNL
ncbi:MAG: peptidylprolyl isomerase [Calditrichia bacterium]